jgi:transcription elongation factor GreB
MSRYRPPRPPSSKYITPEGAIALRAELDELWKRKRPAVTKAVSEAAAQGDRSENAEYIYGKKQLAEIDRRVRYLRKRLEGLHIVDQPPTNTNKVYFGAWFEIVDDEGVERRYRLVGPDEATTSADYISMDSPLGRAVMSKALDDEFTAATPGGMRTYTVLRIAYGTDPWQEDKKKPGSAPGESQGENR